MYRLTVPLLSRRTGAGRNHDRARRHLPALRPNPSRQDALHSLIKGRPPQTYHPSAALDLWRRLKDLQLRSFRPTQNLFWWAHGAGNRSGDVSGSAARLCITRAVVGDAKGLGSRRRLVRDFSDGAIVRYERLPAVASLPELTEPPSYFNREVRQAFQMSWRELGVTSPVCSVLALTSQLSRCNGMKRLPSRC